MNPNNQGVEMRKGIRRISPDKPPNEAPKPPMQPVQPASQPAPIEKEESKK